MIKKNQSRDSGFTLIELLTVIAIIGVLAAIIIPAIGGVQQSALKTKTRTLFSQWATALEAFRQDYGYYPNLQSPIDSVEFEDVLTGSADDTTINTRNISYYSFSEDEFGREDDADGSNDGRIVEAFGNPEINVAFDRNRDGEIDFANGRPSSPSLDPPDPLRGTVVFWVEEDSDEGYPAIGSWE